jgi:hypothetical protein
MKIVNIINASLYAKVRVLSLLGLDLSPPPGATASAAESKESKQSN